MTETELRGLRGLRGLSNYKLLFCNGRSRSIFLNPGKEYQATIYADGDDAHWDKNPQSVSISKSTLNTKDRLKVKLASGGGQVVQLIEQK